MKKRDEIALYLKIRRLGLTPNEYFYLLLLKDDKLSLSNFDQTSVENSFKDKGYDNVSTATALLQEDVDSKELDELCESYRLLFPKGLLPSGKSAKSSLMEVKSKMKWFLSNFSFSKEVILKATEKYIDSFREKNFNYMQTASYFIYKDDKNKVRQSNLAEFCENLDELDVETKTFGIDV